MLKRALVRPLQAVGRRSASSFPASQPTHQCKPTLAGRGRAKTANASVSARLSAAKLSRSERKESSSPSSPSLSYSAKMVKGRSKRRQSVSSSSPASTSTIIPISLETAPHSQPGQAQAALHMGLTPSHMPLTIPLGTEQYFSSPGTIYNPVPTPSQWADPVLGPFDRSIAEKTALREDVEIMMKAARDVIDGSRSALNDHLHVMYALSRPGRTQHLGQTRPFEFDADMTTLSTALNTAVHEAGIRHSLNAEREWDAILAKLGEKSAVEADESNTGAVQPRAITVSPEERDAVNNAVADLNSLLNDLSVSGVMGKGRKRTPLGRMVAVVGGDGQEQWIRMDSTRRKRKKKMNKHRYKKRRRAQKALRKKLGK